MKKHYNSLYRKITPFGTKPHPFLKKILKYKSSGRVLDIGAGQGRNAFFLAQSGFNVTAIDKSEEAVKQMREHAMIKKVQIDASSADVQEFVFKQPYDVIVVFFVLHHLEKKSVKKLIENMKQNTAKDGINVIATFTNDGDFYRTTEKHKDRFYPAKDELKNLYSNWATLEWEEKETIAFAKNSNGKHMKNVTSFLIAQKAELA